MQPELLVAPPNFKSGDVLPCLQVQPNWVTAWGHSRSVYVPMLSGVWAKAHGSGSTGVSRLHWCDLNSVNQYQRKKNCHPKKCRSISSPNIPVRWSNRPHVNIFNLTHVDRNQSVCNVCHPSFGKMCTFFQRSVQQLNKQPGLCHISLFPNVCQC